MNIADSCQEFPSRFTAILPPRKELHSFEDIRSLNEAFRTRQQGFDIPAVPIIILIFIVVSLTVILNSQLTLMRFPFVEDLIVQV
jgi:hypothetical protein